MFDLSDPYAWQFITNLLLVAVALVAATYIGIGLYRRTHAKSQVAFQPHGAHDTHTLILPDLGITMADGGEKIDENRL
jgi:hypothetical protein